VGGAVPAVSAVVVLGGSGVERSGSGTRDFIYRGMVRE
jgi:hypothetical protein